MPSGNLAVQMNEVNPSSGGRMVSADGRSLPLKAASLTADARAGVVRVTLEQRFVNPYPEPLQIIYQVPLPADAAVSGFAFRIGDERIVGQVDTRAKARERFEDALLEGRTAALLEQERSSLFTQTVGNIPPHTEVVSELTVDQKLQFLPDGFWEWRFPTVVAPRYLGAGGRVPDAARVFVDVADRELPVKLKLELSVRDRLPEGARPESPSHALHTVKGVQRFEVGFGSDDGASLDRDVVVRWRAAAMEPGLELDLGRPAEGAASDSVYGLLTLVPPGSEARMPSVARDLIILLDTSGSMGGTPLAQSKRVASALIDSLGENDLLELIEFSSTARRWLQAPMPASAENRRSAQAWLSRLQASGGTEMRTGIVEALQSLRAEAQRQVVLMTDGQIGFETEIVHEISQRMPEGCRVHTVGIGSGVNRSLTAPAARAGRGVEVIIGLDEDAERAAQRVLAHTAQPLVTRVEIYGSAIDGVAPRRVNDLYAAAPALTALKLKPHGGRVTVVGRTAQGEWSHSFDVKPVERGEGSAALARLYARESVEDLEVELAAGGARRELDARITSLGLDFQISTRLTSWVAVSSRVTVDPRSPKRLESVPHRLPYGVSAEGLGLRASLGHPAPMGAAAAAPMAAPAKRQRATGELARPLNILAQEGGVERPAADLDRRLEKSETADEPAARRERAAPPAPRASGGGVARRSSSPGRPAPQPKRDQGPRRIKVELRRVSGGRVVAVFTVDAAGLQWAPGTATLRLKDGTVVGVSVNPGLTTAPGPMSGGLQLTLVLDAPELGADIEEITLVSGPEVLVLEPS
ncbi:MAG: VWA domain-containing protein [Archangiaceae bacterium]|nr:VWA domain-containing protein [Archangiaceae bacterium]